MKLARIADVRVSNVDKKAEAGQLSVRLCNYTDVYYNSRITESLPFMAATATAEQAREFSLRDGDVVITKDSESPDDIAVPSLVQGEIRDLVCGYHLAILRPKPGTDGRFLYYALASAPLRQRAATLANGITRFGLRSGAIRDLDIELPPLEHQRAIADYLDRETARIDALIAAKQRMIDLLTELLATSVTDLLLGTPRLGSPSGPGQVTLRPGWKLVPFRRLFREVDVRSTSGAEMLLSVSQTRGVIPQAELGDRRQFAETLVGYKVCLPGDLVVNRMWVYYGALGVARVQGIVSPDYSVFRPTNSMSSEFAAYVLRTPAYVGEMTRLVRGIGAAFQGTVRKPRLHPEELGLIQMPVPPVGQEDRLLQRLDDRSDRIRRRVSMLQRSIDLLQERRQAVVTAAVSGELAIQGVAV